jgi:hypothetical protein
MDAHPARPIVEEAGARSEGERLDTRRIFRPARHMHLGRRDGGRGAAMQIAYEIPDRALARRVISEGDMDMTVDQAGNCRRTGGVHHHIARGDLVG